MSPRVPVIVAFAGLAVVSAAAAIVLNLVDAEGSVSALVVAMLAVLAGLVGAWLAEHEPPPHHRDQ